MAPIQEARRLVTSRRCLPGTDLSTVVASPGRAAGPRDLDLQGALQVAKELGHVRIAVLGLLGGRPVDRRGEHGRGVRPPLLHVGHQLVDVLHRDPDLGLGLERDIAGQHLVEDDAERVDVGPRVGLLAHRLLGGDVVGGAEHPTGSGQAVDLERAGDSEVGDLGPPVGVDQHVLRLDVAVDQPRLVSARKAAADLDRVGGRLVGRQPPAFGDPLLQRHSRHVLEDDVGVALVLAGVDHPDQVGMGELSDRAGLPAEALELIGLVGDLAVEDLDRHVASERLVDSQVDHRHPAAAELGLEPVAIREQGADHRGETS